MKELTKRQGEILSFVCEFIADRGYPPTVREIGHKFSIRSTNGVFDHLNCLEKKGYLTKDKKTSRSLVPTSKCHQFGQSGDGAATVEEPTAEYGGVHEVPLLGNVAAGNPIVAVEDHGTSIKIDQSVLRRPDYALRVKGDSMIGDGILPGDMVFVRKCSHADSGDVVVVLIDDEATVKRFFREGHGIRLQPSNPTMRPILIDSNDTRRVNILGKVIGVLRSM